jgi:tryptophan 7-halogenase
MQKPFEIVIVGGGTAGWLSAGFLFQQLPHTSGRPVKITLVEASDIPTIGVGEATTPSLRQTLAACGIHEIELLVNCDATFKHGIKFVQWRREKNEDPGEYYFHPFGDPIQVAGQSAVRQWSQLPIEERGEFADVFSVQPEMALSGRAPKHLKDAPYDGALSYAYHLDAGKLAEFLKQRFSKLGVNHIIGTVEDISFHNEDKDTIKSLKLGDGRTLTGDLFLDCTGFAARLINHDKKNVFADKTDVLFVDRAVTTRIAHNGIPSINGYTTSTAQDAGWIWNINLQSRLGVGYVYSSRYVDDDTALETLATYIGKPKSSFDARKLSMRIGYHHQQWRGNCVAVGLSSGFLEPLESTGIYLAEMVNWALAEFIPRFMSGANPQAHYNAAIAHHYENIVDFLKLHYCTSGRTDTPFWVDNTHFDTVPDTLKTKLSAWQSDCPSVYDFDRRIQCFSAPNYQFVLYGMGWKGHNNSDTALQAPHKALMEQVKVRRDRLKQFVLRDTLSNAELYQALTTLTLPENGLPLPPVAVSSSNASNFQLR